MRLTLRSGMDEPASLSCSAFRCHMHHFEVAKLGKQAVFSSDILEISNCTVCEDLQGPRVLRAFKSLADVSFAAF